MYRLGRLIALLLFLLPSGLYAEQISVETTECHGPTSFSSFEERRLFKIQPGACDNPQRPGEKLQQILLHSHSGITRYEVLWVTHAEARNVMEQIKANREVRNRRYEPKKEVIVIQRPAPAPVPTPAPAPAPAPVQAATRLLPASTDSASPPTGPTITATTRSGDSSDKAPARPPALQIIEPPLSESSNHFLMDQQDTDRLIVGRVDAPAGLVSLSINGKPVEAADGGVFKNNVAIRGHKTHVEIVAIDRQGQRSAKDFWLVPLTKSAASKQDATPGKQDDVYGRYHALLIGINDYPGYANLATAIADVEAVDELLRTKYGFSTNLLLNPSRYEILTAISKLRKSLTDKDNLLIYYAGHGEYDRVNLRGHWLPADAEPESPANWISTIDITDSINRMSAKHVMIVADSCYSGAMNRAGGSDLDPGMSEEAMSKWLRVMAATRSRTVLTSGGLKPVADGGGGKHSIFAAAFISALRENTSTLDGTKLFHNVRRQVTEKSRALDIDQVPEYAALKSSDHDFGEFLLVTQSR